MKIELNGNTLEIDGSEQPLTAFIRDRGFAPERIVIEHNGRILEGDDHEKVVLRDSDRLIIVSFVGGG